jgi:hypothetical protein
MRSEEQELSVNKDREIIWWRLLGLTEEVPRFAVVDEHKESNRRSERHRIGAHQIPTELGKVHHNAAYGDMVSIAHHFLK